MPDEKPQIELKLVRVEAKDSNDWSNPVTETPGKFSIPHTPETERLIQFLQALCTSKMGQLKSIDLTYKM